MVKPVSKNMPKLDEITAFNFKVLARVEHSKNTWMDSDQEGRLSEIGFFKACFLTIANIFTLGATFRNLNGRVTKAVTSTLNKVDEYVKKIKDKGIKIKKRDITIYDSHVSWWHLLIYLWPIMIKNKKRLDKLNLTGMSAIPSNELERLQAIQHEIRDTIQRLPKDNHYKW